MIPIYFSDIDLDFSGPGVSAYGAYNILRKNPLYFIRKSVGTTDSDEYAMLVMNTDDHYSLAELIPSGLDQQFTNLSGNPYDIEFVEFVDKWDEAVEPNVEMDGSRAAEPRLNYTVIHIKGFVRGTSFDDLHEKIRFLNYAFDPMINYLEGSSEFDNTVVPNWQGFENVGFGKLVWYKPVFSLFKTSSAGLWEGAESVDAHDDLAPYARLNRFMNVRSIALPVNVYSKFSDFNAPFHIQLLAVDPNIYEFIQPSEFFGEGFSSQMMIDSLQTEGNEDFVVPDYPWRTGPGWREVNNATQFVAHLGRTTTGTAQENAVGWTDFNLDPVNTGSQTLTIKTRWRNMVDADANDYSIIYFRHPDGGPSLTDGYSYLWMEPGTPAATVWWNDTEFTEVDVSGLQFFNWMWIKIENNDDYIRVKMWQHGEDEPASWMATAERPVGNTSDMTQHHFWRFWNVFSADGAWDWQFDYMTLTPYTNPADAFNRTVAANGWGQPDNDGTGTADWSLSSGFIGFAYVGEL